MLSPRDYAVWTMTGQNGLTPLYGRSLVEFAPVPDYEQQSRMTPDVARELPTRENGGLSADGRTYTFHLRRGVRWNTSPARDVTAGDFVRSFRIACNPVTPNWAWPYLRMVRGLPEYCQAFQKERPDVASIRRFVETNSIEGVRATNDSTLVVELVSPAADFLPIVERVGAYPVEYLGLAITEPDLVRRTIAAGPYQPVRYTPDREIIFARNPAWDPAADPVRRAYVDSIRVTIGATTENGQQQMETGAADLSLESPPSAAVASLMATNDPNLYFAPPGEIYAWHVGL